MQGRKRARQDPNLTERVTRGIIETMSDPRPDDFPPKVKRELAARAGHHCSMPSCRAPTSGPSESRVSGEAKIGVAAHIAAASPGGARYDPSQSRTQRQARENGVWLCDTDAKRIDADATRYPRELLVSWREAAEERARIELGQPVPMNPRQLRRLVPHSRELGELKAVGPDIVEFLIDVGAPAAWGENFERARMVLHELALNAFEHGGAGTATISSRESAVVVREDGGPFDLEELRRNGKGGHYALADLERACAGSFTLQAHRAEGENEWILVDEVAVGGANMPCSFRLGVPRERIREQARVVLAGLSNCSDIHFYPEPYWSYSEWFRLIDVLGGELGGRRLVVHGLGLEIGELPAVLARRYENIQFVD